jgi:hypothetical protein
MSVSGTARNDGSQNLHFLGKDIVFNTVGIGTTDTVKVGRIPAGSRLGPAQVHVVTVFNAATTNVLIVGTSSGSDADIVAAGDVDETAVGATIVERGCSLTFTADTDIYVKYTQTGTAATTGAASILIPYFPPNW